MLLDFTHATNSQHPGIDRWNSLINQLAAEFSVPANLVKAHMLYESGGDPEVVAQLDGGCGLMQITSKVTWPSEACENNYFAAMKPLYNGMNILDPFTNIKVACRDFIALNIAAFPGNLDAAICAYNAGIGATEEAVFSGRDLAKVAYNPNYIPNVKHAYLWLCATARRVFA